MKKNIIIAATGSVAAEITSYIEDSTISSTVNIKGYLEYDYNIEKYYSKFDYKKPILGDLESYSPQDNDYFLIGVANIDFRKKVISILKSKNAKFYTLIHPSAIISSSAIIGEGCVISPYVVIGPKSIIGDFNHLTSYSFISHECRLGNNNILSSAGICGRVSINDNNTFYIRSTVIPDVNIGNDVVLSAGSVLTRNANGPSLYAGNPARRIDM